MISVGSNLLTNLSVKTVFGICNKSAYAFSPGNIEGGFFFNRIDSRCWVDRPSHITIIGDKKGCSGKFQLIFIVFTSKSLYTVTMQIVAWLLTIKTFGFLHKIGHYTVQIFDFGL
jgi:hypothetical protein